MKKVLIAGLVTLTSSAFAGHPRCAGSYEPVKCETLEAKLAAETTEQRKARAALLESNRQQAMKEVVSKPSTASAASSGLTCAYPKGWTNIGMSREEVIRCGWGKPDKINRYTNASGTEEQWVYRIRIDGYLYFDTRGILRSMSH